MSGGEKDEEGPASGSGPSAEDETPRESEAARGLEESDKLFLDPGRSLGFSHPRFDPREVFLRYHEALRASLSAHRLAGFLACVTHGDKLDSVWLAAHDDQIRAAIIGRHSRATLALPREDPTAALRHLALLVRARGGQPMARLLDLQTEVGFADPLGRRFEAVRTDGPTFLTVGGTVLMLLPTGPGRELDPDPEKAWEHIPPRRWTETRASRSEIAGLEPLAGETSICTENGPRGCRAQLCRPGEIPVGIVTMAAGEDETHVRVSARAIDEGFLIGRYDRCEMGGPEADESLSRVHLLVVREGDRIIAVDTASTNGTYLGDERVHLVEVVERHTLDLGGVLDLTWRTSN